jgi:hypothetical protein
MKKMEQLNAASQFDWTIRNPTSAAAAGRGDGDGGPHYDHDETVSASATRPDDIITSEPDRSMKGHVVLRPHNKTNTQQIGHSCQQGPSWRHSPVRTLAQGHFIQAFS